MAEHEEEKPKGPSEELEKWRGRVSRAQKLRDWWEREYRVEECEKTFLGKPSPSTFRGKQVNYFNATVKSIQPSLFYSNPRFLVRPSPGKEKSTKVTLQRSVGESLLTAVAKQDFNLERAGRLAVQQSFFRVGVLKCIYDPQLEPNPQKGQPILDNLGQQVETEPDFIVSDDIYRWQWVNSKEMLFPDQGPDEQRWTWIGEEVVVDIQEAKNDRRFPQELRDQLKPNEKAAERKRPGRPPRNALVPRPEDDEEGVLRYFEVFDIFNKRHFIWADDQDFDDFLVNEGTPEGIEDHPYSILMLGTPILSPDPLPWPMPHTMPWLDLQADFNVTCQLVNEGAKRSARKVFYTSTTFADKEEATKALQSSRDMEAVEVQSMEQLPETVKDPDIPAVIYESVKLFIQNWRIVTGQTGARQGGAENTTATEATFVEKAASLRDVDLQAAVVIWLATAGKKMLQLISKTMTLSRWIEIKSMEDKDIKRFAEEHYQIKPEAFDLMPELMEMIKARFGNIKPLEISREALQFEAMVDVVPGSSRPRTLAEERKDWLEFLTIFGQFPQLAMSRELLAETAAKYEFINERMVDELMALAKTMVEINARQAGREGQGGAGGGSDEALMNQVAQLTQ